jgi:hypothetical protein
VELQKHCTVGYARCDKQLKRLSLWHRIGGFVQFESMAGLSFERSRDWLHASVLVGSGRRRPRTLQLHKHHSASHRQEHVTYRLLCSYVADFPASLFC